MIKLISLFLVFNLWARSNSVSSTNNFRLIPIIGYEQVQELLPTPHMQSRLFYGARASYMLQLATVEVEYLIANDQTTDAATNIGYKNDEQKFRLGLLGSLYADNFLYWYVRGGVQGRQNKLTKTQAGVSTITYAKFATNPYIGTGAQVYVSSFFSLNADLTVTYVPTSDKSLKPYEIAPSLGFAIHI